MAAAKTKPPAKRLRKIIRESAVWTDPADPAIKVKYGELEPKQGFAKAFRPLFRVVGEKLPFAALQAVERHLQAQRIEPSGVYLAHDSMGTPRYAGRGAIFARLKTHHKRHSRQLLYFSFFVVDKVYQREIESLLVRVGGAQLHFNERKKRSDTTLGRMQDFEAHAKFYERVDPTLAPKKPKKRASHR